MQNKNTSIEFIFLKNNIILKELKSEDKIRVELESEQEEQIKEKISAELQFEQEERKVKKIDKIKSKPKSYNLNDSNIISIITPINNQNNYCYNETFSMYKDDEKISFSEFQGIIYYNKNNKVIFDLDEKNCPSFELLFYAKKAENLPIKIHYKNYILNEFENNENKYRKRIVFANVIPKDLDFINSKILENYDFQINSFQVLIRIPSENNFDFSLCLIDNYSFNGIYNEKQKLLIEDSDKNILKDFYMIYSSFNEEIKKLIKEGLKIEKVLEYLVAKLNIVYNRFKFSKLYKYFINPCKYKDVNNGVELFHLYYYINEFEIINNIQVKENIIYKFNEYRKIMNDNHEIENFLYNSLIKDENLNELDEIELLRTLILFFQKTLFAKNITFQISYINLEQINKNNPYFKAITLLKDIISKIDEDSRLFEAFLYFDSGIIQNYLEKENNKEFIYKDIFGQYVNYKYEDFRTEYGLSILNANEIKDHLLKLLPKSIIRLESNIKFRAYYESRTKIMIINELIMFKKSILPLDKIYNSDESDEYVIPIAMEILHEMMAHGKMRLNDNNYIKSPIQYKDKNNDFKPKFAKTIIKNNVSYPIGESGIVLENYISQNKDIIKLLKTPFKDNTALIDSSFWVKNNFESLEKIVSDYKTDNKESNENFISNLSDEYDDDDLSDDCYVNCPK